MAEENKKSFSKKLSALIIKPLQLLAKVLSKLLKFVLFNPIVVGLFMFAVGARLHETGHLAGFMGKEFKGTTVLITGTCKNSKGKTRLPALGNDYVTITGESEKTLKGVLRKTREVLECEKEDITFTAMPYELLVDIFKAPPKFPDMPPVQEKETPPEFLNLAKKTLIISGTCSTQMGDKLSPFTDEEVDVTDIQADGEDNFKLYGIKRSDKQAIRCLSTAIKYDLKSAYAQSEGRARGTMEDEKESVIGKILMVSGTCVPDKRTLSQRTSKFAFYKFANSKVQVLEESYDENNQLKKFSGMALDEAYRGDSVVCDKTKWPFIYQVYDSEKHTLDEGKSEAVPKQ